MIVNQFTHQNPKFFGIFGLCMLYCPFGANEQQPRFIIGTGINNGSGQISRPPCRLSPICLGRGCFCFAGVLAGTNRTVFCAAFGIGRCTPGMRGTNGFLGLADPGSEDRLFREERDVPVVQVWLEGGLTRQRSSILATLTVRSRTAPGVGTHPGVSTTVGGHSGPQGIGRWPSP